MVYILVIICYFIIGCNKLTSLEIDRLESGNYFTFSEMIKIVLFWPWQGRK